jgi:hypothetical protein
MPFGARPSGGTSAYASSTTKGYEGCQLTEPRRGDAASGELVPEREKFSGNTVGEGYSAPLGSAARGAGF